MEKKKAIELIKLEVLYCLNEADSEALRIAKEVDADFPWKELGEYQKLVALLPAALTLEFPVSELKDKVALKLYNMRDEIKAKLDAKKVLEEPPTPIVKKEELLVDEEIKVDDLDVSIQEEDSARVDSVAEKIQHKRMAEELAVKTDLRNKVTFDKELVERTVKEYLKSHFEHELKSIRKDIKRNLIISLVLFVISLALIVALFLMG